MIFQGGGGVRIPVPHLWIRPWHGQSESQLHALWVAKDTCFLQADSNESDQIWRKPRLTRLFARSICHLVGSVIHEAARFVVESAAFLGYGFGPSILDPSSGAAGYMTRSTNFVVLGSGVYGG